jgi:hypothetical protein
MISKLAFTFPGGGRIDPVAGMPSGGSDTLQNVIKNGLTWAFVILMLVSLLFIVWGGISWITSQGDKGKVEEARKKIIYAIIGITVAMSSFMLINILGGFLGINIFTLTAR